MTVFTALAMTSLVTASPKGVAVSDCFATLAMTIFAALAMTVFAALAMTELAAPSYKVANTSEAACTVAAMSSAVWAPLTKPASYSAGAM